MAFGDGNGLLSRDELRGELAHGRRQLSVRFHSAPPRTVGPGQSLSASAAQRDAIYHIRAGWACQFRDLANGYRAIVDVYLPGDIIGLDALTGTRRLEEVVTLTSVTAAVIPDEDTLIDLMAVRQTALYIIWLLGHRQRRADLLHAAVSGLDARGRMATILLDFYTRLRRRKLITGLMYNLPLTQVQIGRYLGLTMVHVNRVLGSLRDERIVQVEKHCVTILALDRLESLAQREGTARSVAHIAERPSKKFDFSRHEAAD